MKFEITTTDLLEAVSIAARFVERRPNLPVLSAILVVADGSRVILRATNLECGVEISVPAKVSKDGTVAVPGAVLSGFLGNARGKTVSVELKGEVLRVESAQTQASIKTIPHQDFPILPRVAASNSFTAKAQDIVRAIRNVAYCASLSAVKPELQSVLIYGEAGKLVAVATDSFRLAQMQVPLRKGGSLPQLLVPARNAAELIRILEEQSGDIEIYYSENQLAAQADNTYYTSRLLDGSFPNYKQILPKTFATEAVVLREDLATSLKSLSIFSDKFAQVSVAVEPSKKLLSLTSRNPDVGEQTSTIKATVQGEQTTMSFNSRYLADSLQSVAGDSVRLSANGPGKAILIKDAADDSFLYLAMPMNR